MSNVKKFDSSKIPKLEDYFKGCLYFTAGRLYRLIDRLATESFAHLDMSPSHAFLLMALAETSDHEATPTELAKLMNLDRSTVTRLIQQLEQEKYLKKVREGRNVQIRLLERGKKVLPDLRLAWRGMYQMFGKVFGEKEAEIMNSCISKYTRKF